MNVFKDVHTKAVKEKKTEEMVPTFFEWKEKGASIVGRYVSKNKVVSQTNNKEYYQYLFMTDNGLVKFHMGNQADTEFAHLFTPGDVYAIQFEGKEELKGGRSVNKWSTQHILLDSSDLEALPGSDLIQQVLNASPMPTITDNADDDIPF